MKRNTRIGAIALALSALALTPGCYRKVISAKGIGADELAPRREKPTTSYIEDLGAAVRGEKKK